jgi:acetaldehyde dehydrogenase/alcohol dehydrogenase
VKKAAKNDIVERSETCGVVSNVAKLEVEFLPDVDIKMLDAKIERVRAAQEKFARFSQKEVDKIFSVAAKAASKQGLYLAELAVKETGMGVVEDKFVKNLFASEEIYRCYKNTRTCGVVREGKDGNAEFAAPIGVIAAIIPTTNPTSTAIFKALLALKTRNGMIFSPHPRAKRCTVEAVKLVLGAAVKAGAPEGIFDWLEEPSLPLISALMERCSVTLATGGPGMVRAAYSSGRPAIGVGSGNTPAVIDDNADVGLAVWSIIESKIFDNGMICASEQAVIVLDSVYDRVRAEFEESDCHFLSLVEMALVREKLVVNGVLNPAVVGQSATAIAKMAGVTVREGTKILIAEVESTDFSVEPFACEKLSPVLAMYRAKTFDEALSKAEKLIEAGGLGHTSSIYTTDASKIKEFADRMKTCRILVNTPASQGAIGGIYNKLTASLTLGCGFFGGNSVAGNIGPKHLLNLKQLSLPDMTVEQKRKSSTQQEKENKK